MEDARHDQSPMKHGGEAPSHYARLAAMTALSFLAMFALMYAMVDSLDNVVMNVNQVYMAGLMAAPMVLIELWLMRSMYGDRRRNGLIALGAVSGGVLFFMLIRTQGAVGDRQFVRSMIPHHASAILMCEEASFRSDTVRQLCFKPDGIIASQKAEIAQMQALLRNGTN